LAAVAVLGLCVALYFGLGWRLSGHSTRIDAVVTLVNLASDCQVQIPPGAEQHRMLCRDLPDYLQKEACVPLGSAFVVFVDGKVPHDDTDRVIAPLQRRGYRFVEVLQAKAKEAGAFPPMED
jgi:hypothetical protein